MTECSYHTAFHQRPPNSSHKILSLFQAAARQELSDPLLEPPNAVKYLSLEINEPRRKLKFEIKLVAEKSQLQRT